jgi:hypothetical protein
MPEVPQGPWMDAVNKKYAVCPIFNQAVASRSQCATAGCVVRHRGNH